jgi:hypothetical protein
VSALCVDVRKCYPRNIIQIQIQSKCEEYPGILRRILSVPQNIVMDLNNVMLKSEDEVVVDIFDDYNHDIVCQL